MDGSRFDGITRAWATGQTRRHVLARLRGGVLAGLFGHLELEEAAAACVKPGQRCEGPRQRTCCAGARCQGGTTKREGKCVCRPGYTKFGTKCVNLKNDPKHCGACNTRCAEGHSCKGSYCTSKFGCPAGKLYCDGANNCLGSSNPNCFCLTDVHGTPHCAHFMYAGCSTCLSNADCLPGEVCFDARDCGCPENDPQSNGNACVPASCDGVSGS